MQNRTFTFVPYTLPPATPVLERSFQKTAEDRYELKLIAGENINSLIQSVRMYALARKHGVDYFISKNHDSVVTNKKGYCLWEIIRAIHNKQTFSDHTHTFIEEFKPIVAHHLEKALAHQRLSLFAQSPAPINPPNTPVLLIDDEFDTLTYEPWSPSLFFSFMDENNNRITTGADQTSLETPNEKTAETTSPAHKRRKT